MKRLLIRNLWLVVSLLVFGASLASASTLEYSADIFSPTGSQLPLTAVTLSLPKFNIANGVLSNVEIFVYWSDTSKITVDNTDNLNAHAFSGATASIPLTLSGAGFSSVSFAASTGPIASATSTPGSSNATGGLAPGMSVPPAVTFVGLPCPPGTDCSFNGHNEYHHIQSSGQASTVVSANNFGLFTAAGAGLFNVNLLGGLPLFSGTEIGGLGHLNFNGDILIGGRLVVVYTFTPNTQVPEPMTLLLVGPAVAGLALKLRRRSRLPA